MKTLVLLYITLISLVAVQAQKVPYEKLDSLSVSISKMQFSANNLIFKDGDLSHEISFPEENFKVLYSDLLAYNSIYKKIGAREFLEVTQNIDLAKAISIVTGTEKNGTGYVKLYFPARSIHTQIFENGEIVNSLDKDYLELFCKNIEYSNGKISTQHSMLFILYDLVSALQVEKRLISDAQVKQEKSDWSSLEFSSFLSAHPNSLLADQAKTGIRAKEEAKIKKLQEDYDDAMRAGISYLNYNKHSSAIQKFDEALKFKPNDKAAIDQKNIAVDEIAWKKAFHANTIEALELYIRGNTIRQYAKAAADNIKGSLIFMGEDYARRNEIENVETYLNKYILDYPTGEDVGRAKEIMCDAYIRKGDGLAGQKSAYSQDEAVVYYKKAKNMCSEKKVLAEKIKKAEQMGIRYGRPDRFFYTYAYDTICKYGFSIGTVNNSSLGVYFTSRINPEVFTLDGLNGTVDNDGVVTGGPYINWGNDWRFNNVSTTSIAEGMIGLTKKIVYPLWVYAGAGVSYNQVYWEMDIYDNLGDYYKTDWVKNSDETNFYPVFESGLIVDLKGFNIRGGIKTQDFKSMTLTLGLGFSLVRDN